MIVELPTLLTVQEAAEYLRVTPRAVYEMLWDGRLTGVRLGTLWRIRASDLEERLVPGETRTTP